jgi:hypothetical protein
MECVGSARDAPRVIKQSGDLRFESCILQILVWSARECFNVMTASSFDRENSFVC